MAEAFKEEQDTAGDSEEHPYSTALEQANARSTAGVDQAIVVLNSARYIETRNYYSDNSGLRNIHEHEESDGHGHPFWFDSTNPLGINVAESISDFRDDSMCDSTSSASTFVSFSQCVFGFASRASNSR